MSYIIDIATAVPQHAVTNSELMDFYLKALDGTELNPISRKLKIISDKSKINSRYSCIPDFNGEFQELFTDGNYTPSVERRTEVYKEKLLPLATTAIDKVLRKTKVEPKDITHLITVSCTGVFAPGFEFLVAQHYGIHQAEKLGLNFLGCYAALKALKHANYIAQAEPLACILIVCAELCSLHFTPSEADEDVLSNLLFSDGAAAVIVAGNENVHSQQRIALEIGAVTSAFIPDTLGLMTWNITSKAFQMYLSKHISDTIGKNIYEAVHEFTVENNCTPDHWAIHPGGVRIVDAVKKSLNLSENDVIDSLAVLQEYGNMSSPTILFVLDRILDKVKEKESELNKKVFVCAFGPGLSMEMLNLTLVKTEVEIDSFLNQSEYAVQV